MISILSSVLDYHILSYLTIRRSDLKPTRKNGDNLGASGKIWKAEVGRNGFLFMDI